MHTAYHYTKHHKCALPHPPLTLSEVHSCGLFAPTHFLRTAAWPELEQQLTVTAETMHIVIAWRGDHAFLRIHTKYGTSLLLMVHRNMKPSFIKIYRHPPPPPPPPKITGTLIRGGATGERWVHEGKQRDSSEWGWGAEKDDEWERNEDEEGVTVESEGSSWRK